MNTEAMSPLCSIILGISSWRMFLVDVYSLSIHFFPMSHTISLLWFMSLVVNGMTKVTVLSRLLKGNKIHQGLNEMFLLGIRWMAMHWRDWAELRHVMKFLV